MCGFAGFLAFGDSRLDDVQRRAVLVRMGKLLAHRGPDDEKFYDDGVLSLVFRRLSIVDLSGGDQPIFSEDGQKFIVVNGEIYNHQELRARLRDRHQFSTHSDSEAPLHLFEEKGVASLAELRGMFAMAIWDRQEQRLLLARDRLGIKPLYVCRLRDGLLFGSELKALLAHPDCPRDIDWKDLATELQQLPRVPSYVRGIEHLPGGHCLSAQKGRVETTCWWSIDEHIGTAPFGTEAQGYRDEFERLVRDATYEHLLGDVPIGLHLSGGVDSTLLASIVADRTQGLACFSAVERNTWRVGDVARAKSVAEQLGLNWYPVLFDNRTLLDDIRFDLNRFEQSVFMMDSPRFDLEWIFKEELHRFARSQYPEMKVVLLGQGIDEFAGGYSWRVDRPHGSWADYLSDEVDGDLRYWRGVALDVPKRLRRLVADGPDRFRWSPYQRQMRAFANQLQHFNLWHEDRTSSSQSLEARVPYLDHRIVELLASVPGELHEQLFWKKRIVRDVLAKRLPSYDIDHRKAQFFISGDTRSLDVIVHKMLRRCIPKFLEKYLDSPNLPFAQEPLRRFAGEVIGREGNFYAEGWRLMECMAIAVFAEQCRAIDANDFRSVRERKSGAPLVIESRWAEINVSFMGDADTPSVHWAAAGRIALPQGARVVEPHDGPLSYELVGDRGVYSKITVSEGWAWVGTLLRQLGNPRAIGFSIADWADEFEIQLHDFFKVLDTLHLAGFIVSLESAPLSSLAIQNGRPSAH